MQSVTFQCPACGERLEVNAMERRGLVRGLVRRMTHRHRRERVPYALGASAFNPPAREFDEASFRQPARPATVESDVIVPLFQSAITGGLISLATGLSVKALGYPGQAWLSAGVTGLLSFGAAWWYLLQDSRKLLWQIEELINRDLNRDGQIGQRSTLRVEATVERETGYPVTNFLTLEGITEDDFLTFARAVVNGQSMAVNRWTGSSWTWSRSEFDGLMSELEHAGFVRFRNGQPSQGRELTAAGRAVFTRLLE